jgi:hypothetical protein
LRWLWDEGFLVTIFAVVAQYINAAKLLKIALLNHNIL